MKRLKLFSLMFLLSFMLGNTQALQAQELYYDLKEQITIPTTPSKDVQRVNSCWSNLGAALIEAEMIRTGKGTIDLSEMDFVHNAYIYKVQPSLDSKGKVKVTDHCIPFDVFKFMKDYGMAPESAYMPPTDKDPMGKESGEMDAILRGTIAMVEKKENGDFNNRWQSTYDAALSRYIGDTQSEFKVEDKVYSPKSFAEQSGVNPSDYVMLTSDSRQDNHKAIALEFDLNWQKDELFNISAGDLYRAMMSAIESGFVVGWYGNKDESLIYAEEAVAIVPIGDMPGKEDGAINHQPTPQHSISQEKRQDNFEKLLSGTFDYMTLYGISEDKEGNKYLVGKDACEAGDNALNMSKAFAKLNTVYILVNKNGLDKDLRNKLGL